MQCSSPVRPLKKMFRILKICRSILFGNFFAAAKFWSSAKNVKTITSTKGQWTSASHSIKSSPRKCIFLQKITEQQFVQRYFHNYDVNNWDNVNVSLLTLTSISINKPLIPITITITFSLILIIIIPVQISGSSDWLHQSLLIGSRCTFPLIHCLKRILMKDQDDNHIPDICRFFYTNKIFGE